jgi:hypothetical protein
LRDERPGLAAKQGHSHRKQGGHEKKIITALASPRDLEEELPSSLCVRIHKFYIVSIHEIDNFEENPVEINGIHFSLGKSHRQEIEKIFWIT